MKAKISTSLSIIKTIGGIMKETIIRSTVIVLAVLAVSISINAQTSQQYTADIPFDFEARGQLQKAGKYRLGSMSVGSPGAIGLREVKSGKMLVVGIASGPSNVDWDNPGTLTFRKVAGKYRLSEISTASFNLRMKDAKTDIREVDTAAMAVKVNLH